MPSVEIEIRVGGDDLDPQLWPPKAAFALNEKGSLYRLVPGSVLFIWASDEEGLRSQLTDKLLQRQGIGRQVALLGIVADEGHILGRNGGARQVQLAHLLRVGLEGKTLHFEEISDSLALPAAHHAEDQTDLWVAHTQGFADLTACKAWFVENALYFRHLVGGPLGDDEVAVIVEKYVTSAYTAHDEAYYDDQQRLNDLLGQFLTSNKKLLGQLQDAYMIDDPEARCLRMAPLIAKALDTPTDPEIAGQWQIGAAIERLTGAQVKTKRFGEAAHLLERYFALPAGWFSRSTSSGDETMRKRLERCRRQA